MLLKFLMNSLARPGCWISSAETSESASKERALLGSFFIPITLRGSWWVPRGGMLMIALFALVSMSASE